MAIGSWKIMRMIQAAARKSMDNVVAHPRGEISRRRLDEPRIYVCGIYYLLKSLIWTSTWGYIHGRERYILTKRAIRNESLRIVFCDRGELGWVGLGWVLGGWVRLGGQNYITSCLGSLVNYFDCVFFGDGIKEKPRNFEAGIQKIYRKFE